MTQAQIQKFVACWNAAARVVAAYRAEAPAGFDPQNTWVAIAVGVGGAAISAGTSMYASSQKKKALGTAANANWGEKPKAAEYKPVDFNQEQLNSIYQNLTSLGKGNGDLMRQSNEYIDTDAMKRAGRFIPGYRQNIKTLGHATGDLVSGRLPYDDVLNIVGDRANLTGAMGIPGTDGPATMRDLGLSRLDAIKTGSGLMQNMVQMAETINPMSRRMRPQDNMVSPLDRIRLTMEQNQLIQQSDQNRNNIEAGISPSQQARNQIQLAQAGSAGADTAAIGSAIGGIVSSVGGGLGKSSAGGNGMDSQGFYTSPSSAYSAYSSPGYAPTIMRNPNGSGYYSPYSMPI